MKILQSFVSLIICVIFTACSDEKPSSQQVFNVTTYQPSYAKGFTILGAEGAQSSIIKVKNPWQGAEHVETSLFIARHQEQAPAGFEGQQIKGNATRIVCMSSTQVAMLDTLGSIESTIAVLGRDYISNEYISNNKKRIGDLGRDGNINYELLLALKPDIVLLFALNGASPLEAKLKDLNIPYLYIGDYLENSPLGKAEWMIAIAELIGKRETGEASFAEIPRRYQALKEKVQHSKLSKQPKVMMNTPYADSWVMPPRDNYVAQLIADAGGDYIYHSNNTSNQSQTLELEEAYQMAFQADFWINLGTLSTLSELKDQLPKFADIPCVIKGKVYNANKRTNAFGGNDYWESGVLHPDIVLRDLISIFHPEILNAELFYYHQLQ